MKTRVSDCHNPTCCLLVIDNYANSSSLVKRIYVVEEGCALLAVAYRRRGKIFFTTIAPKVNISETLKLSLMFVFGAMVAALSSDGTGGRQLLTSLCREVRVAPFFVSYGYVSALIEKVLVPLGMRYVVLHSHDNSLVLLLGLAVCL